MDNPLVAKLFDVIDAVRFMGFNKVVRKFEDTIEMNAWLYTSRWLQGDESSQTEFVSVNCTLADGSVRRLAAIGNGPSRHGIADGIVALMRIKDELAAVAAAAVEAAEVLKYDGGNDAWFLRYDEGEKLINVTATLKNVLGKLDDIGIDTPEEGFKVAE